MKPRKELRAVMDHLKQVRQSRAVTQVALERAQSELSVAGAVVQSALSSLADIEAAAAVEGGQSARSTPALKALRSARDSADALEARVIGLRRAIALSESQLIEAADNLQTERETFIREKREEFRDKYRVAAEAFCETLREGITLGRALGTPFHGLEDLKLPGLSSSELPIAQPFKRVSVTGAWHLEVPAGAPEVEEVRALAKLVEREAEPIRRQQEEDTRRQAEAELREANAQGPQYPVREYDYTRPVKDHSDGTYKPGFR